MDTKPVMERIKRRSDELLARAEILHALIETGEGSSAHRELEMIAEESVFLSRVARDLLQREQLRVIKARVT